MQLTSKQLEAAAKKATSWLASQMTEMGNYRGKEPQRTDGTFPDTDDIGCYYKSVYSLRATGQSAAAARMMTYVCKRFQSPEGDFFNTPEVRSSGSYGPYFCQLYQNSWLMRGAVALSWFELANRILNFMNTQRDPVSGGYFTHVNSKTGIMDSNSIAVGAWCCLLVGKYELAKQSCNLLLTLLKNQKDPDVLWSRCKADGIPITDLSDIAEKNHIYVRIHAKHPKQAYWIWGWPLNALLGMYEVTKDKSYFDGAVKIFNFLERCHENAFSYTTAGKDAWGAARLYRMTGDKRYLSRAMMQMEYILNHQHKDGYMLGEGVTDETGQAKRTTFDYTADFTSWLIDNAAEFAAMGL